MKNKYQEALNKVLIDNPKIQLTTSDIHSSILVLKKLVDKETPKKPLEIGNILVMDGCPKCRMPISTRYNYCPECGQKLDWSDEENE